MDLTTLSDEQLSSHLNEVLNEQERRQRLALIPAQIQAMSGQFLADGGDRAELESAIL